MGCTASTERSDDDMQPRRVLEVNELLLNPSSQPPSIAWSPPVVNSSLQHGHPTPDTQIRNPGSGSNFLDQNRSLVPNQAPAPGMQHSPRPSFPHNDQEYLDPWDLRGCLSITTTLIPGDTGLTSFNRYQNAKERQV
ncbi:hypothetical protein VE03_04647 [Pseudogymnoascus sp. 23342-1-I1]|nr:hypothetical protein VE03_04647 [Pseudogymnoascus sp. 23342-1-I1]